MLNQTIHIGKVKEDLKLQEAANGRPFSILTLEVDKQNLETEKYEKDEIAISLWGITAENVANYAGEGSIVSVRGRTINRTLDFPSEQTIRTIGIIGEQVSFIKTKAPGSVKIDDLESDADSLASLNQTILIGRTTRDVELQQNSEGRSYANVTLAVTRSFKNQETNTYDVDFIDMTVWDSEAEDVVNKAGKGSALSIRGHITNKAVDFSGEITFNTLGIVGDKVSFIALKAPQLKHQTSLQKEVESNDTWISLVEIENNPEGHQATTRKMKQDKNQEASLEH